jgi:glycosyltransferase involved in cell wall biosynthesis
MKGVHVLPRIAMVSTFPPTQCGIATFAESLATSLAHAGAPVEIIDLPSGPEAAAHDAVLHRHRGRHDLPVTSHLLNTFDAVILQHEFGIWDGPDGEGIVHLIGSLAVPVISVLHTVPAVATGGQRRALQQLLDLSDAVVVLSHSAYRRLRRDFAVRPGTLSMIPHGATALWHRRKDTTSGEPHSILTWGLLGQGKGLEWGIRAMAVLRDRGVNAEYVIAGATHPNVRRAEGEAYRQSLIDLAERLGVANRVRLADRYLSDQGLADLISDASVFLLPYDSRDQITSGVLVEAIAAGGPVVATRFPHAAELLCQGAGVVVDHQDPLAIADALDGILRDGTASNGMRERSRALAAELSWSRVGADYLDLADRLWRGHPINGLAQDRLVVA